jgi:signal transduction histidine kinase
MKSIYFIIEKLLILLAFSFLVFVSCSNTDNCINLNIDQALLPYRFVETGRVGGMAGSLVIESDGRTGEFRIKNMWVPEDSLSSIIVDKKIGAARAILQHITIKTDKIHSFQIRDIDNDKIEEILVTYLFKDTLYFEILDAINKRVYRRAICTGRDINNNGHWEGTGHISGLFDLNSDLTDEVLIGCITGYDLYPRKLICLDWAGDSILWEYNIAGHFEKDYGCAFHMDSCENVSLLFGVSAPCNGVETDIYNDCTSYIICLDKFGSSKWHLNMGGIYSGCHLKLLSLRNSKEPEVLAIRKIENENDALEYVLEKYSIDGALKKSFKLNGQVRKMHLEDLDSDGDMEIILSFNSNRIIVLSDELVLIEEYEFNSLVVFDSYKDLLGTESKQIVAQGVDQSIWMFDVEFKPLAYLETGGKIGIIQNNGRNQIIAFSNGDTFFYNIQKAPWYRIFSRYPIIAFASGAIPLGIIAMIIWIILNRFRQKNRIISDQKQKLDQTLKDLKETQQKLINAEKYRQAKDIAGGVAHEIHNALNPVRHSLEMLKKQIVNPESANQDLGNELIDISDEAVIRALEMTKLMTSYSKLEAEKDDHQVKLKNLLDKLVKAHQDYIRKTRVAVNVQVAEDIVIPYNNLHAYSVFNNLMLNSFDALDNMKTRSINVLGLCENGILKIEFSDTGKGIQSDSLPKIFDLFYSTKPDTGTGIGLAMVRKIIELYNGRIEVKSTLDKGTKFIILQPIT